MKVLGLITEYNPLHNGHAYHLEQAAKLSGADYTLCVMSGSFLQRGEPAILNKWARTQMALEAGVDVVLELPFAYATSSAQGFAEGAVRLLNATGVVTNLCFGSELGQLQPLEQVASLLKEEPSGFRQLLRKQLDAGLPFPKARSEAVQEYLSVETAPTTPGRLSEECLAEVLESPNNILGLEYLRALQVSGSNISPLTLKRLHADYHETGVSNDSIASATSIRRTIQDKEKLSEVLKNYVPHSTWNILSREFQAGRGPVFTEHLCSHMLMKLRTCTPDALRQTPDVSEGLEYRIWQAAQEATSFYSLVDRIKTKRYTWTRIQRILLHFLVGYTKELQSGFLAAGGPQYLRVLGFSPKGQLLLKEMKSNATLPILTKVAPFLKQNGIAAKMLSLDVMATNTHAVLYPARSQRKGGLDFIYSPVQ